MQKSGKIRFFNGSKGYGFIIPDDGTEDVFVHASKLTGRIAHLLDEGVTVSYERKTGDKGMYTDKITVSDKNVVCFNNARFITIKLPGGQFASEDKATGQTALLDDVDDLRSWHSGLIHTRSA